jgi:hypothetical protein
VRDFESHPVVGSVEAAVALFITSIEPIWPNQNYHHLAFGKTLFKHGRKISARVHINIDKYILASKFMFQILTNAKRVGGAVLTSIAYENLAGHAGWYRWLYVKGALYPREGNTQ